MVFDIIYINSSFPYHYGEYRLGGFSLTPSLFISWVCTYCHFIRLLSCTPLTIKYWVRLGLKGLSSELSASFLTSSIKLSTNPPSCWFIFNNLARLKRYSFYILIIKTISNFSIPISLPLAQRKVLIKSSPSSPAQYTNMFTCWQSGFENISEACLNSLNLPSFLAYLHF